MVMGYIDCVEGNSNSMARITNADRGRRSDPKPLQKLR